MKEVDRVVTVPMEEAIVLQQQWKRDIRTADVVSVAVPRLADYATSWIKSKTVAVKPSTAETYAGILDCHVLPALGDFFLDKLTDRDVREWHAALVDRLAKPTANNALRVLKMVLGDGARNSTCRARRPTGCDRFRCDSRPTTIRTCFRRRSSGRCSTRSGRPSQPTIRSR
jgi:hypothetical protein